MLKCAGWKNQRNYLGRKLHNSDSKKVKTYCQQLTQPAAIDTLTQVERQEFTLKTCIETMIKELPYVASEASALNSIALQTIERTVTMKTWTKAIAEVPCLKNHFGSVYTTHDAVVDSDNSRASSTKE